MIAMKWAKELINVKEFELEKRVSRILQYLYNSDLETKCIVSGVDATGFLGNNLTQKLNETEWLNLEFTDIIALFNEDGQVFEMNLKVFNNIGDFQIIIRDGNSIDILGSGNEIPSEVLGDFKSQDIEPFN